MDFGKVLAEAWPLLLQGLGVTALIAIISIILGLIFGFVSSMMNRSTHLPLRAISWVYVWVIRGTPMLVQAFIVYYGMPLVIQIVMPEFRIDSYTAALVTLSLNAGAYLSEIFRGGFQAVDPGQIEAARSLGLSSARTMWRIIMPQALRVSTPAMVNQFIVTIKDTSILSIIGLAEIVNRAKQYVGATYQFFATYVLVALGYLIILSALMVVQQRVEGWLSYDKKERVDATVLATKYIAGDGL